MTSPNFKEVRQCPLCASTRTIEFNGEICLHFPGGLEGLKKPLVWVFPEVSVCFDCGSAQFKVPSTELKLIEQNRGSGSLETSR